MQREVRPEQFIFEAQGGTAAHSYTDNTDGATGAGNGTASNLET